MSAFSPKELEYLSGQRRLARIATVGADGKPHVVPVGWTYNPEVDTIDIGGNEFTATKKFRDVARSGRAEALEGYRPLIRIHPDRVVSWGLETTSPRRRRSSTVGKAS